MIQHLIVNLQVGSKSFCEEMQETFDDNKEESKQDIQDSVEKSKLGEVVCGSRMLNGRKMKEGENDMEVSQSNNNMDGDNMKKISMTSIQ